MRGQASAIFGAQRRVECLVLRFRGTRRLAYSRKLAPRADVAAELDEDPYLREEAESAKELSWVFLALVVSVAQATPSMFR